MKVFVAGATGVLGRATCAALLTAGHRVTGVAHTDKKGAHLRSLGVEPVSVDLFDLVGLEQAVKGHDVICSFATRIPVSLNGYVRGRGWRANNRLHREVSRNLVDAARASGVGRVLQHSVAFMYRDAADRWIDEDERVDPPPHGLAVLEAERQVQRITQAGGVGVSLRFGLFYGPDAPSTAGLVRVARRGFLPLPGPGSGYVSWIHSDDLGSAVVAALKSPAGTYNVVDDDPITRAVWAELFARALGRKRMRLFPSTVARLIPKRYGYLARSQRISNRRFKAATGWSPTVVNAIEGWSRVCEDEKFA